MRASSATRSRGHEEGIQFWDRLSVFQAVGEDAQRQRLNTCQGFFARPAIGEYTRQRENLGDPAAVGFLFQLDGEALALHVGQYSPADMVWSGPRRLRGVNLTR